MALFSPPLLSWTVLLWAVLLCAAFASCVALVSPPSFGAACFLPTSGAWCCFLLPLFCGAVFLPLPCGWCCLPSPSFFCGAAFLRLLAVLLPFSSETELNTANTTKEAKVNFFGGGGKIVASFLFIFNCSSFSVSYFCWLVDLWEGL